MKPSLPRVLSLQIILICLAGWPLLIGCSTRDQEATDTYNIPWPAADSSYHFQNISIPELSSPDTLSGPDVKIIVTPGQNSQGLTGATPVGHYLITKNGTRIPTDSITTQAVTVHAHIQRLRALTKAAGAEDFLSWPLTIAVEAHAKNSGGAFENNAYFDSDLNALVMTDYSERYLSLSMNGGVIGHEFFHMLFNAIVLAKIQPQLAPQNSKSSLMGDDGSQLPLYDLSGISILSTTEQNSYLLRGINEGLADFWGWVYTGDVNFVGRSLLEAGNTRALNAGFSTLPSTARIRSSISGLSSGSQLARAYELGTSYARFMRTLTVALNGGKAPTLEQRTVVAKALIRALQTFSPIVASKYNADYLSPNEILLAVYAQLPTVNAELCGLFDQFAAPVASSETIVRPAVCAAYPNVKGKIETTFDQSLAAIIAQELKATQ